MLRLKIKILWWSWQNWRKGYQFGPVQRFRCCGHTTPYAHTLDCPYSQAALGKAWTDWRRESREAS